MKLREEQGIVAQPLRCQVLPQVADGAVEGSDLGIALTQHLALRTRDLAAGLVRGESHWLRVFSLSETEPIQKS